MASLLIIHLLDRSVKSPLMEPRFPIILNLIRLLKIHSNQAALQTDLARKNISFLMCGQYGTQFFQVTQRATHPVGQFIGRNPEETGYYKKLGSQIAKIYETPVLKEIICIILLHFHHYLDTFYIVTLERLQKLCFEIFTIRGHSPDRIIIYIVICQLFNRYLMISPCLVQQVEHLMYKKVNMKIIKAICKKL